jgi:hypothetical protein
MLLMARAIDGGILDQFEDKHTLPIKWCTMRMVTI